MRSLIEQNPTLLTIVAAAIIMTLVVIVNRLQNNLPSPTNKLFCRWLRVLLMATFVSLLLLLISDNTDYWRLWLAGLLSWFFIESFHYWMFISAWNKSEFPLFPQVTTIDSTDWPANKRFLWIKDWLRDNDFERKTVFKCTYMESVSHQLVVYENEEQTTRIYVMIMPDLQGIILDQLVFTTKLEDGTVFITDNVSLPFGAYYPEQWRIDRQPNKRSIVSIAKLHYNRINGLDVKANQSDYLEEYLDHYQTLEDLNVEQGIIHDKFNREEFGKVSSSGKFWLWLEMFTINYLGIARIKYA